MKINELIKKTGIFDINRVRNFRDQGKPIKV